LVFIISLSKADEVESKQRHGLKAAIVRLRSGLRLGRQKSSFKCHTYYRGACRFVEDQKIATGGQAECRIAQPFKSDGFPRFVSGRQLLACKGIDPRVPTFEITRVSPHSSFRHLSKTVADHDGGHLPWLLEVGLWGRRRSRLKNSAKKKKPWCESIGDLCYRF